MHNACPSHFIPSIVLTTSPLRKSQGNASALKSGAGENRNILKNEAETEIEKVKKVPCVSDENVIVLGMREYRSHPLPNFAKQPSLDGSSFFLSVRLIACFLKMRNGTSAS
jgi:hypothetical protein